MHFITASGFIFAGSPGILWIDIRTCNTTYAWTHVSYRTNLINDYDTTFKFQPQISKIICSHVWRMGILITIPIPNPPVYVIIVRCRCVVYVMQEWHLLYRVQPECSIHRKSRVCHINHKRYDIVQMACMMLPYMGICELTAPTPIKFKSARTQGGKKHVSYRVVGSAIESLLL